MSKTSYEIPTIRCSLSAIPTSLSGAVSPGPRISGSKCKGGIWIGVRGVKVCLKDGKRSIQASTIEDRKARVFWNGEEGSTGVSTCGSVSPS